MDAEELIEKLRLAPLEVEGGYFRETYRSVETLPASALPHRYCADKAFSTAIYYLLTPDTFSAVHRLRSDEVFHFYSGGSVEMLCLYPDGSHTVIVMGADFAAGEAPQLVVPRGVWQGCRLRNGHYALMGTTVSPAFDYEDYEQAKREDLILRYPDCADLIGALTR